jgi:hypothetical protein
MGRSQACNSMFLLLKWHSDRSRTPPGAISRVIQYRNHNERLRKHAVGLGEPFQRQEIFGGTMNRSRAPVTFNPVPAKAESKIMNAH